MLNFVSKSKDVDASIDEKLSRIPSLREDDVYGFGKNVKKIWDNLDINIAKNLRSATVNGRRVNLKVVTSRGTGIEKELYLKHKDSIDFKSVLISSLIASVVHCRNSHALNGSISWPYGLCVEKAIKDIDNCSNEVINQQYVLPLLEVNSVYRSQIKILDIIR